MGRTAAIGIQSFEKIIENNCMYIDKTDFIREWWESGDDVTLITRPRRFGKTLNMNMTERFFSVEYAGRGQIFEGLSIWKQEEYRKLQGTWPVIMLSFAAVKETNEYMNVISCEVFSSFDTGKKPSEKAQPERFYHGFVLGLLAELQDRYVITSNRESGFGRYDIMLEPKEKGKDAFIIEFKVARTDRGESLEDAVRSALGQIEKMRYETALESRGVEPERIRRYGFAFEGKKVLIGEGRSAL